MIVGITGNPHAGKTLFMTLMAIDALDSGDQVFANFHITYKHGSNAAQFVDLGKLALWSQQGHSLKYDTGVLFLDEAYKGMDSYRSRSTANIVLSYFILQARHYGFRDVYYDAQLFSSVHRRVRVNTDVGVRAWRKLTAVREEMRPSFEYMIQDFKEMKKRWLYIDYKLAPLIWKWYDTHEKIRAPAIALDPKRAKEMMGELEKGELKEWDREEGKGEVLTELTKLESGD